MRGLPKGSKNKSGPKAKKKAATQTFPSTEGNGKAVDRDPSPVATDSGDERPTKRARTQLSQLEDEDRDETIAIVENKQGYSVGFESVPVHPLDAFQQQAAVIFSFRITAVF